MKNNFSAPFCILVATMLLLSCKKKEENPQKNPENELITTVQIKVSDGTETKTAQWKNVAGYGNSGNITIDTLFLKQGSTYTGEIVLLNESNPNDIDTISYEVEEEAEDHQFFYFVQPTSLFTLNILDKDKNMVPIGLEFEVKNLSNVGTGSLRAVLKHQAALKPKSGQGDFTLGSTDVDISIPVKIK